MKQHHRNYSFRPPRREHESKTGSRDLLFRFFRSYLWPRKWALLLIIVIVGFNSCGTYLMAYYSRLVVDTILVVSPHGGAQAAAAATAAAHRQRPWAEDRAASPVSRPSRSLGERMEEAETPFVRPPEAGRMLLVVFVFYVSTMILLNYMARLAERKRIKIGQEVTASLREDLHAKVMRLSLSYHHSHTPGRLMARIMSDVGAVQDQMMNTILQLTSNTLMIIVGTLIIVRIEWRMGLIAVLVLPMYVILYNRARPALRELNREIRHTNSCLYGLVSQKLEGIKAIQAYARERMEVLIFRRLSSCFLRDALDQQRLGAALGRTATIISTLGSLGIFLYGTYRVIQGDMSLGEMVYAQNAAMSLFGPVLALSQLNVVITNLLVVLNRLVDVLDEPEEIQDAADAVDFPHPMRRGIELRNVGFRYSPDAPPVLDGISLEIPAGKWVCFMGGSGSGKSTLLYLLARLYEPTQGQVLVDGVPLSKVRLGSLRRRLALVPQEAQIFGGTIRDNICYGFPDASPTEIMTAAKAAEIHDFIMDMPVKYETLTGERGTSLSGGQRQRLSLARALLTDPKVLLLDDCTSALDANTERKIQETLERIMVGKTAVIVSQRVSMAMRCHRIYVLADGRVSEQGSHEQLMANGGFYSRLYHQQTQ